MNRARSFYVILAAAAVAFVASGGEVFGGGGHGGGGGGHGGGGGGGGGGHGGGGFSGGGMSGMAAHGPSFNSGARSFNTFGNGGQFARGLGNGTSGWQAFGNGRANGLSPLSSAVRGQTWNGSWSKNWAQGEHFSHVHDGHVGDFNHFDHFHDFHHHGDFVIAPFWWSSWWPWWWGGGYGDGYYGYGSPYCYYYDTDGYAGAPAGNVVAENALPNENAVAANVAPQSPADETQADRDGANNGAMFFGEAANAFQAGRYRDALRYANHAAVDSPQNPKAPELMSLSMFAAGDYRGASAQAHAALALGPVAQWPTLRSYYAEDVAAYTNQLRALEKYSREKPAAPEGHFLLAYQYMMTGFTKQAVDQLREVVKLAPADKLAGELLKKYGGDVPSPVPPQAPTPSAF